MHALPKITNPLRPQVHRSWIPPIRFRTKPYLKLSQSLSAALKELEMRYPSHTDGTPDVAAEAAHAATAAASPSKRPKRTPTQLTA